MQRLDLELLSDVLDRSRHLLVSRANLELAKTALNRGVTGVNRVSKLASHSRGTHNNGVSRQRDVTVDMATHVDLDDVTLLKSERLVLHW